MTVDIGIPIPTNRTVIKGTPFKLERKIVTVANVYPGRLLTKDTTDIGVKVCGASDTPVGWAGYETTAAQYKPNSKDTIYVVGDYIAVERGRVWRLAKLAASQTIVWGDRLVPAAAGMVAKADTLTVPTGATTVKSSAEFGAIVAGDVGAKMVVGVALHTVSSTSEQTPDILIEAYL